MKGGKRHHAWITGLVEQAREVAQKQVRQADSRWWKRHAGLQHDWQRATGIEQSQEGFCDLLAQAIVCGRVARRLALSRDATAKTHPGAFTFADPLLAAVVELEQQSVCPQLDQLCDQLHDFQSPSPDRLFDDFLRTHDPSQRRQRGVFYTPAPIAAWLVRQTHRCLIENCLVPWGLADPRSREALGLSPTSHPHREPPSSQVSHRLRNRTAPAQTAEVQTASPRTANARTAIPQTATAQTAASAFQIGSTWRDHPDLSKPPDPRAWPADSAGMKEPISQSLDAMHPAVRILDPAVGDGVFLRETVRCIYQAWQEYMDLEPRSRNPGLRDQHWNDYVAYSLLPRLTGYELMLPAAVMAHWQLVGELARSGYRFARRVPLELYVVDTLAGPQACRSLSGSLPLFTVILGNPPYSGISENRGEWIRALLRGEGEPCSPASYYHADGRTLGERKLWLQDDYVKFFRYAQWCIDRAGWGIISLVTNHGYLDNVTFRGMRHALIHSFSQIRICDLHGNVKKRERTPGGQADGNPFGIEQGIALGLFCRPLPTVTADLTAAELHVSPRMDSESQDLGHRQQDGAATQNGISGQQADPRSVQACVESVSSASEIGSAKMPNGQSPTPKSTAPKSPSEKGPSEKVAGAKLPRVKEALSPRATGSVHTVNLRSEDASLARALASGPTSGVLSQQPAMARNYAFSELWGTAQAKLAAMTGDELSWQEIQPQPPHYFFTPAASAMPVEYAAGWRLVDLFPVYTTAPVTARDGLVVSFSREELIQRLQAFRNLDLDDATIRQRYFGNTRSRKYPDGDTRSWQLEQVRRKLANMDHWEEPIRSCWYRPFDRRFIYWHPAMIDWPRSEVMSHLESGANLALIARRQMPPNRDANYFWITDRVTVDGVIRSDNRGSEAIFPLYLPNATASGESTEAVSEQGVPVNLARRFLDAWQTQLGLRLEEANLTPFEQPMLSDRHPSCAPPVDQSEASWEAGKNQTTTSKGCEPKVARNHNKNPVVTSTARELFAYIFALFHSPTYRKRYAPWLSIDFPHVLIPASVRLFRELSQLGQVLIRHSLLMGQGAAEMPEAVALYPILHEGSSGPLSEVTIEARFPVYRDHQVWLNRNVYVAQVAPEVYAFEVGSHQVCRKWLRDRRGRRLSPTDLVEYQSLLHAINGILVTMHTIDTRIREAGGWPSAFHPSPAASQDEMMP